jgi:Ca2+-binding EF-hand superfamily protein
MKSVIALTAIALASAATVVLAAPDGQQRRGAMLERLKAADTNADGLISQSEAAALPHIAKRFEQIDANRDGQVSFEELRAFHAARAGGHGKKMLKLVDTDGDGKVSKAEALAAAAARFDRADANKDGFITVEEMKASRHGHRGGHRN